MIFFVCSCWAIGNTKCVYNLVVFQNSHFVIRLNNVNNPVILGLALPEWCPKFCFLETLLLSGLTPEFLPAGMKHSEESCAGATEARKKSDT